jgi:alkylation response protein AidB-like acyl-CoA dehydrogenase
VSQHSGDQLISDQIIDRLTANADVADFAADWPSASWDLVSQCGACAWCIPTSYGGAGFASSELMAGYEQLAGACLTTAFILSQRDAAVRRIRDSGRDELTRDLLRPLACGGRFATVGVSQLTTSRQHGAPLAAREIGDSFVLDGVMPWVTGADQAEHIVAGATLADGRQILLVVPTSTPGLRVARPLALAALVGSRTSEVTCQSVEIPRRWLLAGPAPQVMTGGRGGAGGLETSCLALGHGSAAIAELKRESAMRPDLLPIVERLDDTRQKLRSELHRLTTGGATSADSTALRAKANAFVLRATQAALTASKGAGFVRPHPAQRRSRQALFFLVWSCPRPAAEATLLHLADNSFCS